MKQDFLVDLFILFRPVHSVIKLRCICSVLPFNLNTTVKMDEPAKVITRSGPVIDELQFVFGMNGFHRFQLQNNLSFNE